MECPSCRTARRGRERHCDECGATLGTSPVPVMFVLALLIGLVWWAVAGGDPSLDHADGAIELPQPGDAQGTFTPPADPLVEPAEPCLRAEEASLECPAWALDVTRAAAPFGTPKLVDGRIYVGTALGLLALDATTGNVIWRSPLRAVVTEPATSPGTGPVFAVDERPSLSALSWADGRVLWEVPLDLPAVASPLVVQDLIVVAAEGRLTGFNAGSGSIRWELPLSGTPSQPVVPPGWSLVVVGDGNGDIRAVDVHTGQVTWRRRVDGWHVAVTGPPAVVLTSGFGGPLVALAPATGDELWRGDTDVDWAVPHVANDTAHVLVAVLDEGPGPIVVGHELWAYDGRTGLRHRSATFAPDAIGPGLLAIGPDGLLHLGNGDGGIRVLGPDGTAIWSGAWAGVGALSAGWNGHRAWMAVLNASQTQLVALPSPLRELSPAADPLEPGRACPVSTVQERSHGSVVAGGTYELRGLGTEPAGSYEATLLFDLDEATGPAWISGRRIDGPGAMGFRTSFADEPVLQLELGQNGRRGAAGWPAHWGIVVSVTSRGCWEYRIEGPVGVDHIVIEITAEDFEQLPADERWTPSESAS